ncbi:MAG: hypothetical protein NTY17_01465 [Planctomycetia bacterium]|nr:hypothetical protein [Planctomycetia bacterium]
MSHDNDKKAVTLEFRGQGPRDVRVGYVQESPLWKTSYRLVVDDAAGQGQKPQALRRPISFTMDLYQPLYVPRPQVMPELYASLMPQLYGQSLADESLAFNRAAEQADKSGIAEKRRSLRQAAEPQAAKVAMMPTAPTAGAGLQQGAGGATPSIASRSPASRAWRPARTSASFFDTRSRSR